MINRLLQMVAPHYCYGCAKVGSLLCDECKYDITEDSLSGCIVCLSPSLSGVCLGCRTSYQRAWCVGERSDVLRDLINGYKFERAEAAYLSLASLLDLHLPQLPADTVLVPVPTIRRHIRQRGYDHVLLLARELGRLRGIPVQPIVTRRNNLVQLGKNRRDRKLQAAESFHAVGPLDQKTYVLIDDVITTGATLSAAAKSLKDVGAEYIWCAVIARQPLEK